MNIQKVLAIFRPNTSASPRRGFMLFRSFTHTLGFYQLLLTVAFMATIALLFHHFLTTFQEVALAVTAADEELIAMLDSFVNNGLGWLFAIVGIYTVCTLALVMQGARHLQELESGKKPSERSKLESGAS